MSIWTKMKLGGKAFDVLQWARDVASQIDAEAVLRIAFKVFEIERGRRDLAGQQKLDELLEWVRANYPGVGGIASVIALVKALVELANALGLFIKRANSGPSGG